MAQCFIEIGNSMYINVNQIKKIVRNKNGEYFLLLKNSERYAIPTEKALSIKRIINA